MKPFYTIERNYIFTAYHVRRSHKKGTSSKCYFFLKIEFFQDVRQWLNLPLCNRGSLPQSCQFTQGSPWIPRDSCCKGFFLNFSRLKCCVSSLVALLVQPWPPRSSDRNSAHHRWDMFSFRVLYCGPFIWVDWTCYRGSRGRMKGMFQFPKGKWSELYNLNCLF